MTRTLLLLAVSVVAVVGGGCTLLDAFAGVDEHGNVVGDGGVSVAAPIADRVIPGAGAVLGGLAGLWAAFRGRAWKQAAISTFQTIEAGSRAGKSVVDLKADLAAAHEKAGVMGIVQKVVSKL